MLTRIFLFQLPKDILSLGGSAYAMITRKLQSKENIPSGLTSLEDVTQITPLVQRILGKNFRFLITLMNISIFTIFRTKSWRFYIARN